MTFEAGMAMPDKAMRNNQNLIEYHFNTFIAIKSYRYEKYEKIQDPVIFEDIQSQIKGHLNY